MMQHYIYFYFFTLCLNPLWAQKDSVLALEEVAIATELKMNVSNVGSIVEQISTRTLQQYQSKNIAHVLESETGIFVKNNGVNGSSSLSFRGTSAQHTLLLWNGFPIENLTAGTNDLNLISNNFFHQISLQSGGSSAWWGSAAIGGVVHCNTTENIDSGFHVQSNSSMGSFEKLQQSILLTYKNKRWNMQWRGFYQRATNDFPFINTAKQNHPLDTTRNNGMRQYGVLGESYFYWKPNIKLVSRLWYQQGERHLQASMLEGTSSATFHDLHLKTSLEYYHTYHARYQYQIRIAGFQDELIYTNPTINLVSPILTQQGLIESDHRYRLNAQNEWNWGGAYRYNTAQAKNYSQVVTMQKWAVYMAYTHREAQERYALNCSVREELQQSIFAFTTRIATEVKLFRQHFLLANFSKNFRFPTFNDLYWQPGGNSHLLPENSYYGELSWKGVHHITAHNKLVGHLTAYYNYVNNWIVWLPQNSYSSPKNIQVVIARGIEAKIENTYRVSDFLFRNTVHFFYTISTNEKLEESDRTSYQKQLIYTPIYKSVASSEIAYQQTRFRLSCQWVGERFITTDNQNALPAYALWNVYLSQQLYVKKVQMQFSAQIENLLNTSYQSIAFYAQPLRQFQINFQFFF